jgi:hypothetical protein
MMYKGADTARLEGNYVLVSHELVLEDVPSSPPPSPWPSPSPKSAKMSVYDIDQAGDVLCTYTQSSGVPTKPITAILVAKVSQL